jgi:benzoyl-CoA 2,3-dioxygenase component B
VYAGHHFDPEGNLVDEATWNAKSSSWLPTREDSAYVKSLMKPVREPGKVANWIAPPAKGVNGMPIEYEYVKL